MTDVPKFDEVLEAYAVMTKNLADDWTPFLTGLSGKIGTDAYGPDEATADFPTVAKLMALSFARIVGEAGDALATLTNDWNETKEGAAHAMILKKGTKVTLKLKGELTSVTGKKIPLDRVTIVPDQLVYPDKNWHLVVQEDGLKARTYDGFVVATDVAGVVVEETPVSWTIG